MSSESLLLSWQDYEAHIPDMFRKLWKDHELTDVTLSTKDNQQIRAHKVILSSVSNVFRFMFRNNQNHNIVIYLKDIKQRELEKVVEFIYKGQCEIAPSDLNDFLTTGKSLEVTGLLDRLNIGTSLPDKTLELHNIVDDKSAPLPKLYHDNSLNEK